jgi:hypothetical protein
MIAAPRSIIRDKELKYQMAKMESLYTLRHASDETAQAILLVHPTREHCSPSISIQICMLISGGQLRRGWWTAGERGGAPTISDIKK